MKPSARVANKIAQVSGKLHEAKKPVEASSPASCRRSARVAKLLKSRMAESAPSVKARKISKKKKNDKKAKKGKITPKSTPSLAVTPAIKSAATPFVAGGFKAPNNQSQLLPMSNFGFFNPALSFFNTLGTLHAQGTPNNAGNKPASLPNFAQAFKAACEAYPIDGVVSNTYGTVRISASREDLAKKAVNGVTKIEEVAFSRAWKYLDTIKKRMKSNTAKDPNHVEDASEKDITHLVNKADIYTYTYIPPTSVGIKSSAGSGKAAFGSPVKGASARLAEVDVEADEMDVEED